MSCAHAHESRGRRWLANSRLRWRSRGLANPLALPLSQVIGGDRGDALAVDDLSLADLVQRLIQGQDFHTNLFRGVESLGGPDHIAGHIGVLGACAVLFPGIQLIIYFFPMRIRTAAALFLGLYALNLLQRGSNAGGDAAHLAGLLVGAGYAYWRRQGGGALPGVRRVKVKIIKPERPSGPWHRKLREEDHLGQQVDQVLAKIKQQGVASLTEGEKRILAEASRQQQAEEDRLGRTDRL